MDWASASEGSNAWIAFDFGGTVTSEAVLFQDRVAGTDRIDSFSLTFSSNATFGDAGDVTVNFTNSFGSLSHLYSFTTQSFRYVRFNVLSNGGAVNANTGIMVIAFYNSIATGNDKIDVGSIVATASSTFGSNTQTNVINENGLTANLHDNDSAAASMWHADGNLAGGSNYPGSEPTANVVEWFRFDF